MPFELFSFREAYKPEAQFPKSSVRNCPKSLGRAYNVALRATQTVLFGSFWPPYTLQIYARSDTHTPFSKSRQVAWVRIRQGIREDRYEGGHPQTLPLSPHPTVQPHRARPLAYGPPARSLWIRFLTTY